MSDVVPLTESGFNAGLADSPLSAAAALYEHLTGPVAANPHRLGKPSGAPFEDVRSTRRSDYRAL